MNPQKSFKAFLRNHYFILFVISLIIRILYTSLTIPKSPIKWGQSDDEVYIGYASAINDQGLFIKDISKRYCFEGKKIYTPWDIVPPGYPFIISIFMKLFKKPFINLFYFQAIISTFIPLLFFGFLKLLFNTKTSLLFSLWAIVYYPYLTYTSVIMKEIFLFVSFSSLILSMFYINREKFNLINIAYCVSFISLLYLDERFVIYLIVLPVIQYFILKIKNKIIFIQLIIILVSLLPWEWHLFNVYNEFKYMSNRLDSDAKNEFYQGDKQDFKEFVFNKKQKAKTSFIRYFSIYRKNWKLHKNIIVILEYGLLLPFSLLGVIYNMKLKKKYITIFIIIILVHFLVHLVTWGQHRYRYPTDIFIAALSFWGLDTLLSKSKLRLVKKIRSQLNDI